MSQLGFTVQVRIQPFYNDHDAIKKKVCYLKICSGTCGGRNGLGACAMQGLYFLPSYSPVSDGTFLL